jgi:hypothetical protein
MSYLRFVALGELPEELESAWAKALGDHAFEDIDPGGDAPRSFGWVAFDDALSGQFEAAGLIGRGGIVLLRMRVDTLRVPAATLKAYVEHAIVEQGKLVEHGKLKGGVRLSRAERAMITIDVRKQLRRRSLPKMQLIEAAWNISTGELRVLTTSKTVAALFVDLFERTFSLTLRIVGPKTVLWLRGVEQEEIEALEALEPAALHLREV